MCRGPERTAGSGSGGPGSRLAGTGAGRPTWPIFRDVRTAKPTERGLMPRPPPVVYSAADSIPDFPPWATELLRGARPGATWRRLREQTPWMPWTGRSAERRHCPTSATRAWRGRSLSSSASSHEAGLSQASSRTCRSLAMPCRSRAFGTALLVFARPRWA